MLSLLNRPTARAATLHVDDFQTPASTLGWSGSAPTYVASGGPAGGGDGFMTISAINRNLAAHNESPDWVGDYAAIGAHYVTVDLMSPATSVPLAMRLVLFGPGSDFDRWTSTTAQTVPNDGVWRSYTFSTAEDALTQVLGGGTYDQLMGSVLRVMLRHNTGAPSSGGTPILSPGGVLNIDNIRLSASLPAPPGDFNGDGTVDAADLDAPALGWKARFGSDLDGSDFLVWQRHLSASSSRPAVHGVPEPACWSLAAIVLGILFKRRRW